jgi:hypothetical protein
MGRTPGRITRCAPRGKHRPQRTIGPRGEAARSGDEDGRSGCAGRSDVAVEPMPQVPDFPSLAPAMLHHPPAVLHARAAMLHPPPPSLHPPTPSLRPIGTGEGPRMRPMMPAPTPLGAGVVELLGGTPRWQECDAGQRSSQNPGKESPDADHAAAPAVRAAGYQVRSDGNRRETLCPASVLSRIRLESSPGLWPG